MIFALGFLFIAVVYFYERQKKRWIIDRNLVLDSLLEGVILLDPRGKIEYLNRAASVTLSCPKKFLIGGDLPEKEDPLFKKSLALAICTKIGIASITVKVYIPLPNH